MALRTAALLIAFLAAALAGRSEADTMDGCPSILQESVFASGFYSKSLPSSAYFTFQDTVCSLQIDDSLDLVLPLEGNSLDAFLVAAKVLVSGWTATLEARIRADVSLIGTTTQVCSKARLTDPVLSKQQILLPGYFPLGASSNNPPTYPPTCYAPRLPMEWSASSTLPFARHCPWGTC